MKSLIKRNIKLWLVASLWLWGTAISPAVQAEGWSAYSPVQQIFILNGAYYVQLNPGLVSNIDGCDFFNGWYVFVNNPSENGTNNHDKIYAVILTAKALGKTVSIHSSGCNFYPLADGAVIQ